MYNHCLVKTILKVSIVQYSRKFGVNFYLNPKNQPHIPFLQQFGSIG